MVYDFVMNDLKNISYNATCFNNKFSGANQRFFTLYQEVIKKLKNANFTIYEPADYSFKIFFKKSKNVTFVKTKTSSDSSRLFKAVHLYSTIKLFFSKSFAIGEVYNLPFVNFFSKNIIITIHDLRYHNFENKSIISFFYRFFFHLCLRNIDNIITVSHSVKKELEKIFPKKRISVIYNCAAINERKETINKKNIKKILKKFRITNKYLLSVGHFESRKNYLNLLKAFKIFSQKHLDCSLIIVGFTDNAKVKNELIQYIKTNNLSSHVQLLDNVNELEKQVLYQCADLFVFPSLYEGFGIPILEAMSFKCPIVLSNISVFKEITQKKAIYFSPESPQSIEKIISSVFVSRKKKSYLINYGTKRLKDFTVEASSEKLINLYSQIAQHQRQARHL